MRYRFAPLELSRQPERLAPLHANTWNVWAFAQLYSTAFAISILTSCEISYSLAEAKGGSRMPHLRSVQWCYTAHAYSSTTLRSSSCTCDGPCQHIYHRQPPGPVCPHDQIYLGTEKRNSDRNVLTPSDSLRHTLVSLHDAGRFIFHRTETWVIAWLSRLASHQWVCQRPKTYPTRRVQECGILCCRQHSSCTFGESKY
jgi:hypothetical protein